MTRCGAGRGTVAGRAARRPASSTPASECTAVSSSASSTVRSGRMPGQPLGQRGLARARRPVEQQVVAAGRRDLEGEPGVGHPDQVDQVEVGQPVLAAPGQQRAAGQRRRPAARRAPRSRAARRPPGASDRTPNTDMPGTSAASRACGSGTKIRSIPRADAASAIGSTPGTGRSRPSRVSSPTSTVRSRDVVRHLPARGQHPDGDGQVEVRPALGEVGRRQQDRHPPGGRPGEAGVGHRGAAAVARPRSPTASGRPTSAVATRPWETSTWTSTRCPTAPCSAMLRAVATGISRPRPRGR